MSYEHNKKRVYQMLIPQIGRRIVTYDPHDKSAERKLKPMRRGEIAKIRHVERPGGRGQSTSVVILLFPDRRRHLDRVWFSMQLEEWWAALDENTVRFE